MENEYFFVSDTIPKTGVIYLQLYPNTNSETWDEPSNGRIIYPDGTIEYFSAPYLYGKDNLPIPSKSSKAQDAFWKILLGPNVIDYQKNGDLDKVRKERKNSKKFANGGHIAVKVDRGNGIEGYRSVSRNDVNWVRNADGRYVPLLKEFARGGKTRKFLPGGKSAFDFFNQLSGDIKKIGKSVLDNEELSNFGPEVIQGALEMIRNKNRMKTSENAVHRIPLSLINWANLYLRNLQAPNNISLKARFLEDNGMQIGPNGLPVYTEGINNLRNK